MVSLLEIMHCARNLQISERKPRAILWLLTKLNAGLALKQRADLLKGNISANKISLPQGQSYTERKYLLQISKLSASTLTNL